MWRYATRRASKQKRRLLRFPAGYYHYSNEIAVDLLTGAGFCKTYTKSTCSHCHSVFFLYKCNSILSFGVALCVPVELFCWKWGKNDQIKGLNLLVMIRGITEGNQLPKCN